MDENKINNEITEENTTEAIEKVASQDISGAATEQPSENGQRKRKGPGPVRIAIASALLIYAAVILFRQYVFIPGEYEAPPTATPEAIPEAEVMATPEPTPYVQKIPVKMYFTQREVSFPVESVGVVPYTDAKGNQVTDDQGREVYTMGTLETEKAAAWLETGPSPGEYGNAIFNGHVTWKKVAGVFSILPKMELGEEIVVEYADGSTMQFLVSSVDIYTINQEPDDVMSFDTGDSRITLITCYGESWNSQLGTREERCVVVAKPANPDEIIYPYYERQG